MQTMQSNGTIPESGVVDIPSGYKKPVLRALPCNPLQLFVYWELPPSFTPCTSISLSLFESDTFVRAGTQAVVTLTIAPQQNSHYVTVPTPGNSYRVQLDVTCSNGNRHVLHSERNIDLPFPPPSPGSPVRGNVSETETTVTSVPLTGNDPKNVTMGSVASVYGRYSSWSLQERR